MIFINNKYKIIYYSLIEKAKSRIKIEKPYEKHHIIPESFFVMRSRPGTQGYVGGDPNHKNNLVYLTPREHAFCHKLLVKITEGKLKSKMELAIWRMLNGGNKKLFSSKEYEVYRRAFIENIKVINSSPRSPLTSVHKKNISMSTKGIAKTEEAKTNMRNAWVSRSRTVSEYTRELNRTASNRYWSSDEAKATQSFKRRCFLNQNPDKMLTQLSNLNRVMMCEHCGANMNIGNYKRWHGPKCKLNKEL